MKYEVTVVRFGSVFVDAASKEEAKELANNTRNVVWDDDWEATEVEECLKEAKFTSVWDDNVEVSTNCKVNIVTHEVFDIQQVDVGDSVDVLNEEYITLNGEKFQVFSEDEWGRSDIESYWYK